MRKVNFNQYMDGFKRGAGGVVKCDCCGHNTRRTYETQGLDHDMCPACFDIASWENTYQDGEMTAEELRAIVTKWEKKYGRKLPCILDKEGK